MEIKNQSRVFRALSSPLRLRIVLLLFQQELCVCELMFILKMGQSRISHQLRILRDADLAEDVRRGRWIIYRLPLPARKLLRPLLEPSFGAELKKSAEVVQDVRRLHLCLRQEVRLRQGDNRHG